MTKDFVKADVNFQRPIVVINTICVIVCLLNHDLFVLLMMSHFIAGAVQWIGSGLNLKRPNPRSPYTNWRRLHFWGSIVYLGAFYSLVLLDIKASDEIAGIFILVIPQIILYAYFLLSILELRFLESIENTDENTSPI
jgi:hypothetical protein